MYEAQKFAWWSEEQKKLADDAAEFVGTEIFPLSKEYEGTLKFPWKMAKKVGEGGWFGFGIPEKYGGLGEKYGVTGECIINEELGRIGFGLIAFYGSTVYGVGHPLSRFGTAELKEKYLTKLARGEMLGAVAITEPYVGSDAAAVEVTARLDGGEYVLNGKKRFITNAGIADLYTVYCRTDESPEAYAKRKHMSAILVERDTPGFTVEKINELCGMDNARNGVLDFENVRVPKENLLAEEGNGWVVMTSALNAERTIGAAGQVGGIRAVIDTTLDHTGKRMQFGRPVNEFQALQFMIADMVAKMTLARTMVYSTAYLIDQGVDAALEASVSKLYVSECMTEIARDAIQCCGGDGYTRYYPLERAYRDAKLREISAGTNQVQRLVIWRQALGRHKKIMESKREEKVKEPSKMSKEEINQRVLETLGEHYKRHPGMYMDREELKIILDISNGELDESLTSLEKEELVALHRTRKGTISLVRATYQGLKLAKPEEYYKMIPGWAEEDLETRLRDVKL
jgi:alkylation response protein AidB-like acyl-CoA dehydrogenase